MQQQPYPPMQQQPPASWRYPQNPNNYQ
jgi:hypothetical protein